MQRADRSNSAIEHLTSSTRITEVIGAHLTKCVFLFRPFWDPAFKWSAKSPQSASPAPPQKPSTMISGIDSSPAISPPASTFFSGGYRVVIGSVADVVTDFDFQNLRFMSRVGFVLEVFVQMCGTKIRYRSGGLDHRPTRGDGGRGEKEETDHRDVRSYGGSVLYNQCATPQRSSRSRLTLRPV